ncbi:poly-gamma-glutamate synthesis protein (capsule biosynthesis protein) [Nonomuraea polychroma]|uniref:Poly-gamma-glutamate synthesis protein (Capsule biosynthesis protein) n=1 Tax=Nonomuraea polychroma TaxID=46176 RepID=A0A438MD23_9ACTN|nr:CapA family protein [Nonomuraea polychroma]RVX43703.1 poly-gamma-glutamate synthesis protein (capsule biosynthesis protein) [Nonomuraea polychroma]
MTVTLALAGDTMLGRGVADELAVSTDPDTYLSDGVRAHLAEADAVVLNLECCISDRGTPWLSPGKPFFFRAPPQAADLLAEVGVSCVTLANNHALDYGYDALLDTRAHLDRVEVHAVGAGADEQQARQPVVLAVRGLRIGVIAATDHPLDYAATPDRPGVAYVDLHSGVPSWLTDGVAALRAEADAVLVTPHWGPNMTPGPLAYIRAAADTLVEAGASLVAGHSAHVVHGVAPPVLYDMGDFLDDYIVDPELRNDLSFLFLVTVDELGPVRLRAVPLKLEYARTVLADGEERAWLGRRFASACADFGATATWEDGLLIADMR